MDEEGIEELSEEPCGLASAAFRTILAARERATEAFHQHKRMLLLGSAGTSPARIPSDL